MSGFEPTTSSDSELDEVWVSYGILMWLVDNEMPFSTVDQPVFRRLFARACPRLKLSSQKTISEEVYEMYQDGKGRLHSFIEENAQRVCLTTDTWTSISGDDYLVLTAHFVDNEWNLQKRILNVCLITGHSEEDKAKDVERCLKGWCIEKISTITVNNATFDAGIEVLIRRLGGQGDSFVLSGKYAKIRCMAHILNLVVQDELKSTGFGCSIDRIRAAIKYVKSSTTRYKNFKKAVKYEGIKSLESLCLDVPTHWNSTYTMLSTALSLKRAFYSYELFDHNYATDLGSQMPQHYDWGMADTFVTFLKPLKRIIKFVSNTSYVTSNLVLRDLTTIDELLQEWLKLADYDDGGVHDMKQIAWKLKEKYDKHWGFSSDRMNHMLYYAAIVDPRLKYEYIKFMVDDKSLQTEIWNGFEALFNEYKRMFEETAIATVTSPTCPVSKSTATGKRVQDLMYERFVRSRTMQSKPEFDRYFEDGFEGEFEGFDILKWWKRNCHRYPIISKMARDILAVPISTIESEFAFSIEERTLDQFKSSLSPKILQALICGQDWLQHDDIPLPTDIEESEE